MKQLATLVAIFPFLFTVLATQASASEGFIKLNSTDGSPMTCNGFSALMPSSLDYMMLIDCENIVYPTANNQFNYVAWAQPSDGGNPIRLGTLGVGTADFEVDVPFNQIFVTSESSSRPRTPSDNTVLRGNVTGNNPADTNEPARNEEQPQSTPTSSPVPEQQRSFFSRLFQASNIIPFVGVILLLILVFILTRR